MPQSQEGHVYVVDLWLEHTMFFQERVLKYLVLYTIITHQIETVSLPSSQELCEFSDLICPHLLFLRNDISIYQHR
jgi:hypothetical protein